jgi:hypothetical protein
LIKNFCLLDEIILGLKMQIGPIKKEGTSLDKVVFFAFKEGIEILNKIASAHCGRRQFERQWKKVSLLANKIDVQTNSNLYTINPSSLASTPKLPSSFLKRRGMRV